MSPTGRFVPAVPGQGFKRRPKGTVTTSQTSRCLPRRPNSKRIPEILPPPLHSSAAVLVSLLYSPHFWKGGGGGANEATPVVVEDGGANARLGTLSLTNAVGALCDIMTAPSHLLERSNGSEGLLVLLVSSSADYGQILVL